MKDQSKRNIVRTEIVNLFNGSVQQTKICRLCHIPKLIPEFSRTVNNKDGLHTECKECSKESRKIRYKILKFGNLPPKPNKCICCGKPSSKYVLDHDTKRNIFRGWICSGCNRSIGMIGDTYIHIFQTFKYLIEFEHTHNKNIITEEIMSHVQYLSEQLK